MPPCPDCVFDAGPGTSRRAHFSIDKQGGGALRDVSMAPIRLNTKLRRSAVGLWAIAGVVFMHGVGYAAATATSCAIAKQKAAGKSAAGQLGCYAKATKKGVTVDLECLQKATDKFAGAFAKIEMKGQCVAPGFAAVLETMVDALVADVVIATPPGSVAKCAAAKQKAAAKSASSKLGCYTKATKKGVPVDTACLQKAADKFTSAFAKEDAKTAGGCATLGIAASIGPRVDTFVASVVSATPVVEPPVRCCANGGSDFCADLSTANESQCPGGYGGTLGGPGLVCDGTSGTCLPTRGAATAGCCDTFTSAPGPGLCLEGSGAAAECSLVGGTFHTAEKCLSSGTCGLADAPGAAGPWAVGHRQLDSVDTGRVHSGCLGGSNDGGPCSSASACPGGSCVNAPSGRSLPLHVWYPIDPAAAFGPFTAYPLTGPFTLASNVAHEGAAVSAAGMRPLIVFSHGSGGIAIQSVHLMEQLASHGFVVVAPNHTGNSQTDASASPPIPSVSLAQALLDRVPDVSFVIDHMVTLSTTPGDPFFGRIDGLKIGVAGHSLGGFTALAVKSGYQGILPDARVNAIMPIAPAASAISDAELGNITVPTLFMTGTLDGLLADEIHAAGVIQSSPFNYRADVIGATHTHFANICDIANVLLSLGFGPSIWPSLGAGALVAPYYDTCVPPAFPIEEATRLQNLYATAFFRRHLLGETSYDPFLTTGYAVGNEPDISFVVTP
jgi:predicted dienelactone hydrolase